MNARAVQWFKEDDWRDLQRWAIAALIVLGVYAAVIGGYVFWLYEPDDVGSNAVPIVVDVAPGEDAIDQSEIAPTPDQPPPEVEKPPETPPPPPVPDAAIPQPEKVPEKVEQQPPQQYVPAMTAATPYIDHVMGKHDHAPAAALQTLSGSAQSPRRRRRGAAGIRHRPQRACA